jgi:hypothetical protein
MADRPIIFSAPMVRALLDGRKTQTRRALNRQPIGTPWFWTGDEVDPAPTWFDGYETGREPCGAADQEVNEPMRLGYAVSDRLWVREAWHAARSLNWTPPRDIPRDADIEHAATSRNYAEIGLKGKLRPAMFLPRWASRITLIVTDVRVQRLQEISEADAIAEGISPLPDGRYHCGYDDQGEITCKSPVTAFGWVWNGINGKRPGCHWQDNPWVAAITFDTHHCNIDAMPTKGSA